MPVRYQKPCTFEILTISEVPWNAPCTPVRKQTLPVEGSIRLDGRRCSQVYSVVYEASPRSLGATTASSSAVLSATAPFWSAQALRVLRRARPTPHAPRDNEAKPATTRFECDMLIPRGSDDDA